MAILCPLANITVEKPLCGFSFISSDIQTPFNRWGNRCNGYDISMCFSVCRKESNKNCGFYYNTLMRRLIVNLTVFLKTSKMRYIQFLLVYQHLQYSFKILNPLQVGFIVITPKLIIAI